MKKVPETYNETNIIDGEEFCSNFDGIINNEIVERMKNEDIASAYPAWDWHGSVWFDKECQMFCCEVWRYGTHISTEESDTPEELKDLLCEKYGNG